MPPQPHAGSKIRPVVWFSDLHDQLDRRSRYIVISAFCPFSKGEAARDRHITIFFRLVTGFSSVAIKMNAKSPAKF